MSQGLHVLKFGGSVLRDDDAVATVARAIHTRVRAGQRLVAVVSATRGTTDRLLAEARDHGAVPDPHALAELLATGERRSASLLALALHREGVACEVADAGRLRLRTQGPPLDADPVPSTPRCCAHCCTRCPSSSYPASRAPMRTAAPRSSAAAHRTSLPCSSPMDSVQVACW